ncbi:MAG: ABC transporter permease [Actinobacteria bacterium]|nr:ABC transporter permease [Actinomycetota bacterium]
MATTGTEEFTLDTAAELAAEEGGGAAIQGRSPWVLAARRLRRNYVALAFLALFLLIVVCCLLAPVYSSHISGVGPNDTNINGTIVVNGQKLDVVSNGGITTLGNGQVKVVPAGVPIGPQWFNAGGKYVLGADNLGRDLATRILYGGENSLQIGLASAAITTLLSIVFALLAGYYGGVVDWIITRFFDLIWAFPVILLGIALGTALSINGFHHFGLDVSGSSLWIPTAVISYVYIPYIGRPLRGQVLALREKEFIEAAVAQGASSARIMVSEILPNLASSILVLFTLIVANTILTEAALSFLGAGVQPPNPSWGTLISDGESDIVTAPWWSIAPGVAIVLTVLSLNVFGDALRDALDPRAKVRIEH